MRVRWVIASGLCGLLAATALAAASPPLPASPGDPSQLVLIATPCPTFSWGAVDEAMGYELVVYVLGEEDEEAQPVLRQGFVGSVSSWTPSLDRCLERGGGYAWSVRALGTGISGNWSPPNLFQVVSGPSEAEVEEAFAVLRRHFGDWSGRAAPGWAESAGASIGAAWPLPSSSARVGTGSAALSSVAGDSALQVSGAAVVTTATFAAGLCEALTYRYIDQGDGTVLDCETELVWLRNAKCLTLGPNGNGTANWTEAQAAVAGLASGKCGLTDGSQANDWRQPTIHELCSAGPIAQICPAANAPDSLVDSSVSGFPKVANARGDAAWSEGDAFSGLLGGFYWSATQGAAGGAWYAFLGDGTVGHDDGTNDFRIFPVREGP